MKIESSNNIFEKYKDCIVHNLNYSSTQSILFIFSSNMCIKDRGRKWWDIAELMRKLFYYYHHHFIEYEDYKKRFQKFVLEVENINVKNKSNLFRYFDENLIERIIDENT